MKTTYRCPECNSDKLLVSEITKYEVNSGKHYCYSYKSHDSGAPCECLDCDWVGMQLDLVEVV
jgi:hypothetical protein